MIVIARRMSDGTIQGRKTSNGVNAWADISGILLDDDLRELTNQEIIGIRIITMLWTTIMMKINLQGTITMIFLDAPSPSRKWRLNEAYHEIDRLKNFRSKTTTMTPAVPTQTTTSESSRNQSQLKISE